MAPKGQAGTVKRRPTATRAAALAAAAAAAASHPAANVAFQEGQRH